MTMVKDDAPPTTSKSQEVRDAGTRGLIEPRSEDLIGRTVTINRPRAELYAYWRDFTKLPSFMDNVERIDIVSDTRSHWVVKAPAGKVVE